MSQDNQKETVIDVEEDVIDAGVGEAQRKKGMTPAVKLLLILGLGGGAIAGALLLSGTQNNGITQVVAPPALDATPGGASQADSPEFQEFLRSENERRAALALELGVTSLPTPEIVLQPRPQVVAVEETPDVQRRTVEADVARPAQPTTRRILPSPQGQQVVQASQPVTPQTPVDPQPQAAAQPQGNPEEVPENIFTNDMIRQMGAITPRLNPVAMQTSSFDSSNRGQAGNGADNQPTGAPSGADLAIEEFLILRPGDILYGETLVTIDSDNSTPALVEIVSGDLRGSRLVGGFTADRRSETLVVNFTNITLPDGRTTDIEAFAVDARSAQIAVSSDVERRFISRYAPILASTFISAYADALSQPDQTVIGVGDAREVITSSRTARQSLFAGLGAATGVIAQDVAQGTPVGPRIILRSGYPVAILVVEPVSIPARNEAFPVSPGTLFNSGGR